MNKKFIKKYLDREEIYHWLHKVDEMFLNPRALKYKKALKLWLRANYLNYYNSF